MKKIVYLIIIMSIFSLSSIAFACTEPENYKDIESSLLEKDTAIALYKIVSGGETALASLVIGNENTTMNINLSTDTSSCSTKSEDFSEGDYIVVVYKRGQTTIKHVEFDNQFSFFYKSQDDAMNKYNELLNVWDNRADDKNNNTEQEENSIGYKPVNYSLKPGMKNDDVLALQTALKAKLNLGEDFKLDGSYGPMTISAVKQFQVSQELTDDGIAGVLTQGKLAGIVVSSSEEGSEDNNTEQEEQQGNVQEDNVDQDLKRILIRAKNEIIYYAVGGNSYTDAYELVSGYNNTFLDIYSESDPLYKSSGGGLYFVYSLELKNGNYICVDNNFQKEIIEKPTRPDINTNQVSC